jgi:MFS family permease
VVISAWTSPPSLTVFLISGVVAGAGIGAIIRGSLTVAIGTSDPDDRAGTLATFFTAGYVGISLPVIGIGLALQHLSPRVTLLIFGVAAVLVILAAAPILTRPLQPPPPQEEPEPEPVTGICRCFGAANSLERDACRVSAASPEGVKA